MEKTKNPFIEVIWTSLNRLDVDVHLINSCGGRHGSTARALDMMTAFCGDRKVEKQATLTTTTNCTKYW